MEISTGMASILLKVSREAISLVSNAFASNDLKIEQLLTDHIRHVHEWSQSIQLFGMPESVRTDHSTVSLGITNSPRRFHLPREKRSVSEVELIDWGANTILLGDPGSGKTTTLKRIANAVLNGELPEDTRKIDFPLLVVVREMADGENLLERIAAVFGFMALGRDAKDAKGRGEEDPEPSRISGHKVKEGELSYEQSLRLFLAEVLERVSVLILVDGVDEVGWSARDRLDRGLRDLAEICGRSQIIATCRSGSVLRQVDSYAYLEILPLNGSQIDQITERWATDPSAFRSNVADKPYADLCNRPLVLCQIILIFNSWNRLPERPVEIYRRIAALFLERWDRERGVDRASHYADFSTEAKANFLSSIAYFLLSERGSIEFSHGELLVAYRNIYQKFGLKESDAEKVVSEIEGHTGLIVEMPGGRYAFSHLSLQEYFCANHLCRLPDQKQTSELLMRYPEAASVAVCLSSDEGRAFSLTVFPHLHEKSFINHSAQLAAFVHRIEMERPIFTASIELGHTIIHFIYLLMNFEREAAVGGVWEWLWRLRASDVGRSSVEQALSYYTIRRDNDRFALEPHEHSKGPGKSKLKELFFPRGASLTVLTG